MVVICREEHKGNTPVQCVDKTQRFGMLKQAKELWQLYFKSGMTKLVEMGISIVHFEFICSKKERSEV
jgi:hypothetical protein